MQKICEKLLFLHQLTYSYLLKYFLRFYRREEVPKRLRYPEKKPVLKKRPVTEPKQQPKPPIQTLVKNPSINVDEFSAPAAPIKQNIVSVFGSKI